jgi:hypothetical protein
MNQEQSLPTCKLIRIHVDCTWSTVNGMTDRRDDRYVCMAVLKVCMHGSIEVYVYLSRL